MQRFSLTKHLSGFSLALAVIAAGSMNARAAITPLFDPGFENETAGSLADSGGVNIWSSYGDNNSRFTIVSGIAHTGTQSITNTESFSASPAGFTNLYQFATGDTPSDLAGKTVNVSFWIYYDASAAGQNQSSDSIGFDFSARDAGNVFYGAYDGTVLASTLVSQTWTQITGTYTVAADASATRLAAVLQGPTGKFYADDFTVTVVPEPVSLTGGLLGVMVLTRRTRKSRKS